MLVAYRLTCTVSSPKLSPARPSQEFGLARVLPLRTSVTNGWETCCTGAIALDLGLQVRTAGSGHCLNLWLHTRGHAMCVHV